MDPHDPPCGSLSDTESVRSVPQQRRSRTHRRLRLTWQVEQGADTAHRDVRAASQLVEALARRVGCIPDGAPLPRAIQQQRWSPFNVPLMWSAAGTSATTPIVEWMVGASRGLTLPAVEFHEGSMEPEAAVVVGWTALREVFRGWGIMAAEDLTTRLCQEGFPRCSVGNHISARAQEHILRQACEVDARVALLEVMYVLITVHLGVSWQSLTWQV